jgi:putative acetyltransferase
MIREVFPSDVADIAEIRALFTEYSASLNVDLCFQNFEQELAGLPGYYVPPRGGLWLAELDGRQAGCVALRPLQDDIAEMKRLYVRPGFRGHRFGKLLAEAAITRAGTAGYARIRLDTMPFMNEAISLYRKLGFEPIEPYRHNPVQGALYMEKDLLASH